MTNQPMPACVRYGLPRQLSWQARTAAADGEKPALGRPWQRPQSRIRDKLSRKQLQTAENDQMCLTMVKQDAAKVSHLLVYGWSSIVSQRTYSGCRIVIVYDTELKGAHGYQKRPSGEKTGAWNVSGDSKPTQIVYQSRAFVRERMQSEYAEVQCLHDDITPVPRPVLPEFRVLAVHRLRYDG